MVSAYTDSSIDAPYAIASGPDGALWFTNVGTTASNGSIGRITITGVVTNYTDPSISDPQGITRGPDGALWFTNIDGSPNSIGRITAVPSASISPASGPPRTSIAVSGEGYTPGEQVNVTYNTGLASTPLVAICSTTVNPDGTFACAGRIPSRARAGATGAHRIKAKGVTSLATAKTTFTLT